MWPTNKEPLGELGVLVENEDGDKKFIPINKCMATAGSKETRMSLDELIIQTVQQNNIAEEDIRNALVLLSDGLWTDEQYIKALGILGNAGIHGAGACASLASISRLWKYSRLNEASPIFLARHKKRYGLSSFSALCALQEELYGVVNL